MRETIGSILEVISYDFFISFGFYTFLYLIFSRIFKKLPLDKIDKEAVSFISLSGVVYLAAWVFGIVLALNAASSEEAQYRLHNRMFGPYWFGFWLQPILWILLTQLLRIESIRKNIFARILFSLVFIVSFERLIIIFASFHRDYLPSSWTIYYSPFLDTFFLIVKIGLFLLYVYIYSWIKTMLSKMTLLPRKS